jgi:serine/threonine protein kinase
MAMSNPQRYRLEQRIGRGGMAEVYRARMLGTDGFEKIVCIKRILAEQSRSPGFEAMFCDEARIAALLCHANIVQVFDFDRDERDRLFIVMEYVHGVSLRRLQTWMAETGMDPDPAVAAAVARGALQGLHHGVTHLHDGRPLGVIHRDISPHNILLSTSGEVKIADFGIAKAFISSVHTRAGVVKGKASYMSPEQGAGKKLDVRTDLYSLGVVLWEMLANRRLFVIDPKNPWISLMPQNRVAQPLREAVPGIPESLASLIDDMLAPDRADRPATAAEALQRLESGSVTPLSAIALGDLVQGAMPPAQAENDPAQAPTLPDDSPPEPLDSNDIVTGTRKAVPDEEQRTPGPVTTRVDPPQEQSRTRGSVPRWVLATVAMSVGVAVTSLVLLVVLSATSGRIVASPPEPSEPTPAAQMERPAPDREIPTSPTQPEEISGSRAVIGPAQPVQSAPAVESAPVGRGSIDVNAKPWAKVYLDGKSVGFTPIRLEGIKAGPHVIKLVNDKLDSTRKVMVKVPAGGTASVSHDFVSP